jgi:hypothetical protein
MVACIASQIKGHPETPLQEKHLELFTTGKKFLTCSRCKDFTHSSYSNPLLVYYTNYMTDLSDPWETS